MKIGNLRTAPFRSMLMIGAGLLLFSSFVAAPVFTHGKAADIPPGSQAFGALWTSIEPVVPNFWGPAVQPALQEPYREGTNGSRLVQYFDKARMEQTTASGPVTNGLLTVELITGQQQMGDASFAAFLPSVLPIVGDPTNTWPPYAALGGTVFPAKVGRSGEPSGTVYKSDGAFGINPGLGADPGAQFGTYQSDPGGRYAHNIPVAFASYLAALPVPWLSTMGFPLTEPFWVNVNVGAVLTWVLVQPFERRVLSYTPSNPPRFQVEMGNIGQHYYQWRYGNNAASLDDSTAITTPTGGAATTTITTTATQGTPTVPASGTPRPLTISSVQLGTVTESAFTLTFKTSVPATSEILYGTASHSYTARQNISMTSTQEHAVTLSDLQAGTKYYFALRAIAGGGSNQSKESFFTTASTATATGTTQPGMATGTTASGTVPVTGTTRSGTTTATATTVPATATGTGTTATATATATATTAATATKTPTSPTATSTATPTTSLPSPTSTIQPASPTPTPLAKNVRLSLTNVKVRANNPAQIAPPMTPTTAIARADLEQTTVALALAYDGSSNASANTIAISSWTRDMVAVIATGVGSASPLTLADRQSAIMLTATATIPFEDTTIPPIVVTFSRKILPTDYGLGITIISPPLNNARSPGFSITLTFSASLSG